jgi:hypothetical protein
MRNPLRGAALALALCLALAPCTLAATELGLDIGGTNLDFLPDQVAASTTAFPATNYLFPSGFWASQQMAEGFKLVAGWRYDPVLRSQAYASLRYNMGFAELSFGPFFGLFNGLDTPLKPGLSSGVRIEAPGIAYFAFKVDSSIGSGLVKVGDYSQSRSELSAGLYLRNAICSFGLYASDFAFKESATLETVTSTQLYDFSVDIFKKNVPYRIYLHSGYEFLGKTFVPSSGSSTTDALGAVVLGAKLSIDASPNFSFYLGFEASVYTFGLDHLVSPLSPAPTNFYFNAGIGFTIRLDDGSAQAAKPAPGLEGTPQSSGGTSQQAPAGGATSAQGATSPQGDAQPAASDAGSPQPQEGAASQ